MKQDGSALTRLEAAMLGMWLMGYRVLYGTTPRQNVLASKGTGKWDVMYTLRGELFEGLASNTEHIILPWLESHGITPPEVEG